MAINGRDEPAPVLGQIRPRWEERGGRIAGPGPGCGLGAASGRACARLAVTGRDWSLGRMLRCWAIRLRLS
jgi:hypothetical protein